MKQTKKAPALPVVEPFSADAGAPRPYWIPEGISIDDWPTGLQAAVAGVINPAYQELVVEAAPGLAQSTGITIVHLLWLEVLEQVEQSRHAARAMPPAVTEDRAAAIERYLRLVNAKLKASQLLHRLTKLSDRLLQ